MRRPFVSFDKRPFALLGLVNMESKREAVDAMQAMCMLAG
ncbi:hypothetical protein Shel_22930 [Slackia heliotrinireducens DSM 20476]|uniref:Uncharacterized protein n=1 Tax=Slackia heliotrinireducens (strain ATCC 29202 / DSM 20476 / NCTC 11029 / RHS 1) TaxID=471855 RepID=C7N181_SLAHD|nr:hypothetical protein Shel_22930 [Slackia heliotrinireducens DSM 20476]